MYVNTEMQKICFIKFTEHKIAQASECVFSIDLLW